MAPVETTRTPRVRVVATSGGGGFGKQQLLFAKLHRTMLFLSRTLKRLRVYYHPRSETESRLASAIASSKLGRMPNAGDIDRGRPPAPAFECEEL